jgi:hypothetical protein
MLFVGVGAAAYLSLAPKWPQEQHLRVVLGDDAPHIQSVGVRCGKDRESDWMREVTFRYAKGEAPRIVSYEPRLANGDYLVEIELEMADARVRTTDRQMTLAGGTTSIDLSRTSR